MTVNLYERTEEILSSPDKWVQCYREKDGGMCLMHALGVAAAALGYEGSELYDARNHLLSVIQSEFPAYSGVAEFNDAPETTFESVRLVLAKAKAT